ncbi:PA0069 family radical SAM protein [Pedomonas sp. V897]|uniref:PA0069 family radical SAM protein n=1 Tax=Pedomonas sp. V897 TaxID=3446482 RepID=UPI003EE1A350
MTQTHGRAATNNRASPRFGLPDREADGDWLDAEGAGIGQWGNELPPLDTTVTLETPRTILTRNQSPDLPFDRSVNAYRGCEHGCIYCYARPTHAYMDLSPGLDFETKLFAKPNAAALLEQALGKRGYVPAPIAMGTNTDPYQPIEKRFAITRSLLEVMDRTGHPVTITTKNFGVTRDLDLLSRLAARNLVIVNISVTTLDHRLARAMEPRASTPKRRIEAIRQLAEAGVPVNLFLSPLIPGLNDHEIERIVAAGAAAGARGASSILLRLPWEVAPLFEEWLKAALPDRAARVLSLLRQSRDGRLNDPAFGSRMSGGDSAYARMLRSRFRAACARHGLDRDQFTLSEDHFRPPDGPQLSLF